jgi:hypothetical protein
MKERPILFSAPMVRALLAGTKTQTRRVVKLSEEWHPDARAARVIGVGDDGIAAMPLDEFGRMLGQAIRCPYGQPGDRLWVREAFMHEPADYCWEASVSIPCRPAVTTYRADVEGDSRGAGWSPSIHMPRALSRIDLEITAVRVERLQSISEADARAEGIVCGDGSWSKTDSGEAYQRDKFGWYVTGQHARHNAPSYAYRALWEQVNGPGSWDANPWVWVVEFRRVD